MENGEVAHGVMDPDSIARRSEVAPRISEELKTCLIKRLDEGLTARQVFEEHKKVRYEGWIKKRNLQKTTIYFLIMFVTMSIKEKKLVHAQKYIGECEYVEIENLNVVFYYQNGDAIGGVHFTIGIHISWQKTTLLKYGKIDVFLKTQLLVQTV